jgi:DNA modification methylase
MKTYYSHAGITIYHGDSEEMLPMFKADMLLTDPPYGIGEAAGKNKTRGNLAVAKDYGNSDWDNKTPPEWMFGLMRSRTKWQVIFGGNYFPLPPSKCWLVWDKENGDNDFADCELAWTNFDKAVRRIVWRWHGMLREGNEDRFHPTQKPLNVMKWALSFAPADVGSVLDPYMGSGTSLLAAKQFRKTAIGIEKDERYCEIAAKRLQQEVFDFGGVCA